MVKIIMNPCRGDINGIEVRHVKSVNRMRYVRSFKSGKTKTNMKMAIDNLSHQKKATQGPGQARARQQKYFPTNLSPTPRHFYR